MASWFVRSTPERAVRVRALAGDSVLCSWARHFTLTVPLSTQVYKWVPAICWGNLTKLQGSDLRWTSIPSRGCTVPPESIYPLARGKTSSLPKGSAANSPQWEEFLNLVLNGRNRTPRQARCGTPRRRNNRS